MIKHEHWKLKIMIVWLMAIVVLSILTVFVNATPAGPSISYVSNSTITAINANRNQDAKGTITVLTMTATQQDYKWKAYVGNISGSLTLDDAAGGTIYDWALASITGEVYVTRASSVSWSNISCVNQSIINAEDTYVGISSASQDSINKTFINVSHKSFLVGGTNISNSTCRSTATYVSDAAQVVNETAKFQEVLLRDVVGNSLIYAALIDNDQTSYDGVATYDFQLIVAENESSSTPITYYFYAELG